jgi:hypothetical protein
MLRIKTNCFLLLKQMQQQTGWIFLFHRQNRVSLDQSSFKRRFFIGLLSSIQHLSTLSTLIFCVLQDSCD